MDNSYLIRLLKEISDIMSENRDHLIEMDSIVGDGDLGLTMGTDLRPPMRKSQTVPLRMPESFIPGRKGHGICGAVYDGHTDGFGTYAGGQSPEGYGNA